MEMIRSYFGTEHITVAGGTTYYSGTIDLDWLKLLNEMVGKEIFITAQT